MKERKTFAVYAITTHGIAIAERLLAALPSADLFVSQRLRERAPKQALPHPLLQQTGHAIYLFPLQHSSRVSWLLSCRYADLRRNS